MPRNTKNSAKANSNQFELLDIEEDGTDDNTVGSWETASKDKEYHTMVVYLDKKEEVDGTACKDDSRDGKWRVRVHSAIRSGTSASKVLPLPPLWTSTLSLQGAIPYLWTVCSSWSLYFDLYLGRLQMCGVWWRGTYKATDPRLSGVSPGTRKVTTVNLLITILCLATSSYRS
jgi:hypothetical protein